MAAFVFASVVAAQDALYLPTIVTDGQSVTGNPTSTPTPDPQATPVWPKRPPGIPANYELRDNVPLRFSECASTPDKETCRQWFIHKPTLSDEWVNIAGTCNLPYYPNTPEPGADIAVVSFYYRDSNGNGQNFYLSSEADPNLPPPSWRLWIDEKEAISWDAYEELKTYTEQSAWEDEEKHYVQMRALRLKGVTVIIMDLNPGIMDKLAASVGATRETLWKHKGFTLACYKPK